MAIGNNLIKQVYLAEEKQGKLEPRDRKERMEIVRERLELAASFARAEPSEPALTAEEVSKLSNSVWGITALLKPHQAEGVSWLIRCYLRGFNVILGDEMGLGKTLQAVTFISYLKFQRKISGPFFILCPLSVVDGWSSEFSRYAPKLRIVRYIGTKDARGEISKEICRFVHKQPNARWDNPNISFDVLLTTYDLAMVDEAFLSKFCWKYTVIDEAQRLKNSSSVLYKTLENNYMIPRRLLMTGTPIQNNLSELWALLHFCMPKVFNNLDDFILIFPFSAFHELNDGSDELKLLKSIVNVFMLRRTKDALVENKTLELPSFSEITILAKLVPLQKTVYLSILKKELPKLMQKRGTLSQMSLQNIVVQLRKACSHPYLFDGVEPEPFEEGEHLIQASGKMIILDLLLKKLFAEKHRVLIYAQMTRTLDILQDYLEFRGYLYERLDGSVRAEERFASARKFNANITFEESTENATISSRKPFVFLLTTRAGGVGLNLTAADTVIFYEQDWNPQADKQAVQRAHRIGQVNPVLAINLVAEDTIDEVILSRAKKKLKLTHDIIGYPSMDSDSNELDHAKPSDLRSMIIFGLDKLHPSAGNESGETETMVEISKLVQEALEQRYNRGQSAQNKNIICNGDLEEDFYTFEGQDFSSKRRKYDDEQECPTEADRDILDSWIQKLGIVSDHVLTRQSETHAVDEMASAEYHKAKQKKAEERRIAKWESLGYKSLAVQDPGDAAGATTTHINESRVHLVFGDCTKPSQCTEHPAIIFSIVDNSGTWGSGGMFSALNKLSPHAEEIYAAAHAAGDLHMGDFHLIPLDVEEGEKQPGSEAHQKLFVGLGVVQSYDSRRKIPRSDISIPALEVCLRKATNSAKAMSASIHMPRISSHPQQDRREWYAIERLLRKYASLHGVDIYIYYYKQPNKNEED